MKIDGLCVLMFLVFGLLEVDCRKVSKGMEFIKSPKNATVEEDQGHSFHCNIKRPKGCSRRKVKVKWYHNGSKLMKKDEKGRNFKIKRSGAVLRFDNIRMDNDGAYYCIVNCVCCNGSSGTTMRAKSEKAYLKVEDFDRNSKDLRELMVDMMGQVNIKILVGFLERNNGMFIVRTRSKRSHAGDDSRQ